MARPSFTVQFFYLKRNNLKTFCGPNSHNASSKEVPPPVYTKLSPHSKSTSEPINNTEHCPALKYMCVLEILWTGDALATMRACSSPKPYSQLRIKQGG